MTTGLSLKDTVHHDESTSDHADDNDNGADMHSGDSTDEAIVVSTLGHSDNTEPPVSSLPVLTQHAGLCPNARNSQKQKYTCESDFTTTRRRKTQKSRRRTKSSVVTAIRGKHSQLIIS